MAPLLRSWSWQEIFYAYRLYGSHLRELERIKNVFGFKLAKQGIHDGGYGFANDAFRQNVAEVDGILILIEAEIKRRKELIGIVG